MTTNLPSGSGGDGRGDRPRRPALLPATAPVAPGSWPVERRHGGAGSLFSDSGPGASRVVRVLTVDAAALVLGSTQAAPASAPGVEVVRRRSGGGAVLLRPGETVWVDVVVPAGDPLWEDDVARSFWWLGEVWAAALGGDGLSVHRGPMVRTPWSSAVCFAGVGPGEVVSGSGKVVGLASRRAREGALFQCAVPLAWDAAAYVELLALPASAAADLARVAAPVEVGADEVVDAFLSALP